MNQLSLLTLNIANPSPDRAQRQLAWLAGRTEDVLALTETKDSAGCRLLADAFTAAGYHVAYPIPDNGYGVMIASKLTATTDDFGAAATASTSPASPTQHPPCDRNTPPTKNPASPSNTAGGPNPTSAPIATNSYPPTSQHYSPTSSTAHSTDRSFSTHKYKDRCELDWA